MRVVQMPRGMLVYGMMFCVVVMLAACGSTDKNDPPSGEIVNLGRGVYVSHCAACHGANGEGQNPEAPLQRDETGRYPAPPHNENGHTWHHDDDLLVQIVKEGGMGDAKTFYEMPPFGDKLTDEEIHAVLAYIKTLWTDEQRANQQQATEAVREQHD